MVTLGGSAPQRRLWYAFAACSPARPRLFKLHAWHAAGKRRMFALAASLRRLVIRDFAVPDVGAHLAHWLTVAIDGEQADAVAEREAWGRQLPVESRLRIATFFALASGVLFLPVDGTPVGTDVLAMLLLIYAAHAALTSFVLIASFTGSGRRRADSLALVLVIGHAVNLEASLWAWPKYPGLTAGVLACLLMGNAVLFSWSTGRVLGLAIGFCTAFVVVGLAAPPHGLQRPDFAVAAVVLLVGAATAIGCTRLLAVLRSSLTERQRELTQLSSHLIAVQEEERRRLARDLHDEFGQVLTAVNANLWIIERQPPADPSALRDRAAEARRLVNRTLAAMRQISHLLRPSLLDTLGLLPSLEQLVRSFGERQGIATSLSADGLPARLSPPVETALYRITQEALTNVARHARARRVRVALAAMGDELRLEIEDDGVGFTPSGGRGPQAGIGLVGIRERVRALGGELAVNSGKGVRLEARVPLSSAAV